MCSCPVFLRIPLLEKLRRLSQCCISLPHRVPDVCSAHSLTYHLDTSEIPRNNNLVQLQLVSELFRSSLQVSKAPRYPMTERATIKLVSFLPPARDSEIEGSPTYLRVPCCVMCVCVSVSRTVS